ncbi:hypothetical protein Selin_1005 [Desulfurispirillum indicum S5]|uniref:Uncharacterized protein n=1 Tax=Desulfurispirillum indicum (strain ATCC BAA-1389 / DSM 22839 / S5) TaxID=653733 RepID=E6W3E7_DESIS|nr:hypothetical protein [Desulfurispirillum indicum]ADU65740.1 hypothetical protein Selin_1005 [Desulfurispirillum indicum S5]
MFSTSITQGVNPYSQVQKNTTVRADQSQAYHGTAQTRVAAQTDAVVLSEEARRMYGELVPGEKAEQVEQDNPRIPPIHLWENLVNDPEYAEEMARFSAYQMDRPLLRMNPDAVQVPGGVLMDGSMLYPDGTPVTFSDGSWQEYEDAFNREAALVREQRIKVYEEAVRNGVSGADLYRVIHEFNFSLPESYLEITGRANRREMLFARAGN